MNQKKLEEQTIEIPEGVDVAIDRGTINVKGPKGEVSRRLVHPKITISTKENKVHFLIKDYTKKEKVMLGTFKAHIKNLMQGVLEGYTYQLKICSGHFPMTVSVDGNKLVIKNFLGEKVPRKAKILEGVKVDIKGDQIELFSLSKEDVGQTAGNMERSTRITNRDRRIFQDGIFITAKGDKHLQ